MEHPRIDVARAPSRCPFCHESVALEAKWVVCSSCLARHHAECWREVGSRCATCSAQEPLARRSPLTVRVGSGRTRAVAATASRNDWPRALDLGDFLPIGLALAAALMTAAARQGPEAACLAALIAFTVAHVIVLLLRLLEGRASVHGELSVPSVSAGELRERLRAALARRDLQVAMREFSRLRELAPEEVTDSIRSDLLDLVRRARLETPSTESPRPA